MAYLNQGGLDYFWEKVKELANSTITVSPKEVSGSIATFDDGSEIPVKSLSVNIDPVQAGSGDPSPDNVRPISGWDGVNVYVSGKNLLNINENDMISVGWNRRFPVAIKGGTYTISCVNEFGVPENFGTQVRLLNEDSTVIKNITNYDFGNSNLVVTFTVSDDEAEKTALMEFAMRATGATFESIENGKIQLELGSTATAYEPYKGTVYPISLPSTVYGGVLDVGNGTLTVKKVVDTPTFTSGWTKSGESSWWRNFTDKERGVASAVCSHFPVTTYTSSDRIQLNNTGFTSLEELSAYQTEQTSSGTPITIVYWLATPLTINLTPTEVRTILGYNNIYADSGDVSVVYCPQAAQKPTIEGVKTSTISVPTGTEADLLDEAVAVKAGHSYAISYAAQFAANSTGYRRTKVYVDGTDAGVIAADIQPAVSGAETVCRGEHWFAASSNGEVMIKGLQNSGGALFASTSVRIIDLGN